MGTKKLVFSYIFLVLGVGLSIRPDKALDKKLFDAVQNSSNKKVARLLNEGADPCAQDLKGFTPLHDALGRNDKEVFDILLENAGTNVHKVQDNKNNTLIHFAAELGFTAFFRKLCDVDGADLDANNVDGLTPLHVASFKGHELIVQELLGKGASVDSMNVLLETPLFLAVEKGCLPVVKILLEHGANLYARNIYGYTPVKIAIHKDHVEILQVLREWGSKDLSGDYLECDEDEILVRAINKKDFKAFGILLGLGVDVNIAFGDEKTTPLHEAVKNGNEIFIQELLRAGAKVNAKDKKGRIPLHFANGSWIVTMLLDHDAHKDEMDSNGFTPLHFAVHNKRLGTVRALIKGGADVNFSSADMPDLHSVLHFATMNGNEAIVEELTKAGARTYDRDPHRSHKLSREGFDAISEDDQKLHRN